MSTTGSRTTVSNYQLSQLQYWMHAGHVTIKKAQEVDQRAFRSFLVRKWIAFRPGYGFHITPEGKYSWDLLHRTEYHRHDPTRPLTRYFDYVAYGEPDPRAKKPKTKLRVVRKGAAA